MECKFIKHGVTLGYYDQTLRPCCVWQTTSNWREQNNYLKTDIATWHQSAPVVEIKKTLENDQWPTACANCERIESQNRFDSMRGNGNQAYANYKDDDIFLEIRPGNTCNFACQTCWPEASSRVAHYYNQAGLIDIKNLNSPRITDFEFLTPIANRIKDVVVLGGETFYDKACLKFLSWARKNLKSNILLFTNGSMIDTDFLSSFQGKLTIIFSLDAVGRAAEYVRVGTIWSDVLSNFEKVKKLPNVEVRVNITCSVYNYWHLEKLIELLCKDWPAVVSFGQPNPDWYKETVIPTNLRPPLIESLERACLQIQATDIESGQKSNAINAIQSIVNNLRLDNFNKKNYDTFCDFVKRMDRVKGLNAGDYCDFLDKLLQQEIT